MTRGRKKEEKKKKKENHIGRGGGAVGWGVGRVKSAAFMPPPPHQELI